MTTPTKSVPDRDVASGPNARPLQIIRLGTAEENFTFNLEQENLDLIMHKIPSNMKVAVVSVVGAFRTGKSFLLTFLLRYLRYGTPTDESEAWMTAAGDVKEGNINENSKCSGATESSFQWRAGKERTTTGIWMWSEPFFRRVATGEEVAVLLMDTQGMFDNETSMNLTACIFGLSTLLSSYQIYNVQNRIQEDNLQHLALFSEYGRIALTGSTGGSNGRQKISKGQAVDDEGDAPSLLGKITPDDEEEDEDDELMLLPEDEIPFQRLEFLVRDWMDFEEEEPFHKLRGEMDEYLQEVIERGSIKDLKQTRDQILSCFEKVRCFILPHPGLEVPKRGYSGAVEQIHPLFRRLLNHYAREVFGPELEPKRIHKRDLTGPELREYVLSYVKMFKSGTKFPEAQTMLEATAAANNQNAKSQALTKYRDEMDSFCGPGIYEYRKIDDFLAHHRACKEASLKIFDNTANIGRRVQIKEFRKVVLSEIEDMFIRYEEANANRNPFRNFEYYALPLFVAMLAFILRWVADLESSCSIEHRYLCTAVSNAMGHIYVFLFTFIVILSFNRIKMFVDYIKQVVPVLVGLDRKHIKEA